MKTLTPAPMGSALPIATTYNYNALENAISEALEAVEGARQKCFVAGMMLLELKNLLPEGQFLAEVEMRFPNLDRRTVSTWMRCGANFLKALPKPDAIDVEASVILTTPDDQLTPEAVAWKGKQLELWNDYSIREASKGVLVEGDADHRLDRCINGKTKGGVGKQKDRKAFERFTATKLQHITSFLTLAQKVPGTAQKRIVDWRRISPVQQTQISAAFCTFLETAPVWLLETLADKIKTESKLSKMERFER